jgi:adenine-specific DNA methylase
MRRLIESWLPLREVNEDAGLEVGFKSTRAYFDPKLRNVHTWFARRPASVARVLTLAGTLGDSIQQSLFTDIVGFNAREIAKKRRMPPLLFYTTPKRSTVDSLVGQFTGRSSRNVTVVDPMAGGGSIPLESLRLGFRTIAVEYNPVAYLVLKATIEFPAKYADSGLFEETVKAARELLGRAKEELGEYFGVNSKSYIYARGVRCPHCRGLIPVEGVSPEITRDPEFKGRYLKVDFDRERKTFTVETLDERIEGRPVEKRGLNIRCPYCNHWLQLRGRAKTGQTLLDRWFVEHSTTIKRIVEDLEEVTLELEDEIVRTHIPLIKRVGDTFKPAWGDEDEMRRFRKALRDLSREILELQDYIPLDEIPRDNRWASTARNKGLTKWYMLFNPRQLLTIAKLSRIVAEIAEKQLSRNGEMGAAVALYLAFAVDKVADYDTIATIWHGSRSVISPTIRGESTIDFRLEYAEVRRPKRSLGWALELDVVESGELRRTAGGILPVLKFLCDEFRGSGPGDRVSVYLGDATRLSELLGFGSVDVVNVDPPYFEQVIYSDRSEFFWVLLRRSLRPVLDVLFKPGLRLSGWSWSSPTVPRDREVVAFDKEDSGGRFRRFFREFVGETYKVLRDDGVLILWFTHPTDLAWRTVGESLYEPGYVVSRVWPVITEMETRYKRHVNVVAQRTSLIIVARKTPRSVLRDVGGDIARSLLSNEVFSKAAEEVVGEARRVSKEASLSPADVMTLVFGSALTLASKFEIPGSRSFQPLFEAASTKVLELFVEPLVREILTERGPVKLDERESSTILGYVREAMLRDPATRAYLTLWMLSRVDLEKASVRSEALPLSYDFAQTVSKLLGYSLDNLRSVGLIGESTVEEDSEENEGGEEGGGRRGRAFYPRLFEALTVTGARVPLEKLLTLTPGKAVYVAYLALKGSGAPDARAEAIRGKLATWSSRDVVEASSIAVVLLETARDRDLGFPEARGLDRFTGGGPQQRFERELAIRTLVKLVERVRGGGF